jgi:hypothetical protein
MFPDRADISGVEGQEATDTFGSAPMKATVRQMFSTSGIPQVQQRYSTMPAVSPQGRFIIIQVDLENVGQAAQCCVPEFRLHDARKRVFTGKTQRADTIVEQAASVLGVKLSSGDLQPNMKVQHVLVFDVPQDAAGLKLVS